GPTRRTAPRRPLLRRGRAHARSRLRRAPRSRVGGAQQGPRRARRPVLRDLMFLQVEHRFAFEYDAYISDAFLELRVQPKTTSAQPAGACELEVAPPRSVSRYRAWNDTLTHHFTITKFHDRTEVVARSLVQTHPAGPPVATLPDRPPLSALPYPLRDFLDFGG